MPHARAVPAPGVAALVGRLLLAAAIIAGLFGMHVLMSPGAHSAHATAHVVSADGAHSSMPAAQELAGDPACEPSACAEAPSSPDAGVWGIVCVLALLLTALVAVRPLGSWREPRRTPAEAAVGTAITADDGPRHPPSLIALSISRT